MEIKLRKGLNLPILGETASNDIIEKRVNQVALIGLDYIGMKPTMLVKEGDSVKIGQPLFSCKKNDGLIFTAPGAGTIQSINRGERRLFQSISITLDNSETHTDFKNYKSSSVDSYSQNEVAALMVESGAWAGLRQRPFDKVAPVGGIADNIFVTASDTHPLAPNPVVTLEANKEEFHVGLQALKKLTQGKVYVCFANKQEAPLPKDEQIIKASFNGPHPAGCVGTHIHFIKPVNMIRKAWHMGYQDVVALGHLFKNGQLYLDRLISLAGPYVKEPKLIRTRRGACLSELTQGELKDGARLISGSVLHGRQSDAKVFDFLGHYSNQISAIEEDTKREFLGWQTPGLDRFSTKNIYLSKLIPGKKFNMGSSTFGSPRAMVPIGMFEKIMPLDILPTQLLRSLVSKDTETAQELGCLELAEEDLGLCTFVAPGKVDFGPILRANLDQIEKEG